MQFSLDARVLPRLPRPNDVTLVAIQILPNFNGGFSRCQEGAAADTGGCGTSQNLRTTIDRLTLTLQDTALVPVHAAVSKPAQRAYLGTLLFTLASCILIAISSIAYVIFYYNFIPQIGVERVIHLQFG